MRYILTMTLDNEPPGTDVTGIYKLDVLTRLIEEGYVEMVDDEADYSDDDGPVADDDTIEKSQQ